MHVQMCVYGLSCCPSGHDIDTARYYNPVRLSRPTADRSEDTKRMLKNFSTSYDFGFYRLIFRV